MRYLVTGHSITTSETTGQRPDGEDAIGRHWFKGSLVDLDVVEAEGLFKAGAVGPAGELSKADSPVPPPPSPKPPLEAVEQPTHRDETTPAETPKARRKGG